MPIVALVICILLVVAAPARAQVDEASLQEAFNTPQQREAVRQYLGPLAELEKQVHKELAQRGDLPADAERAQQLSKDYAAFYANYYARIFNHAPLDIDLAARVLANPDFREVDRSMALLAIYLKSGKADDLKAFLIGSPFSAQFFLKVQDPSAAPVALGIIADAYGEVTLQPYGPAGERTKLVAQAYPALAGIMYRQRAGAAVSVGRRLLRDYKLFTDKVQLEKRTSPAEAADLLLKKTSNQACEDFVYTLYENGDGTALDQIRSGLPDMGPLVLQIGEKYRDAVRATFDKVGLGRAGGTSPTTNPQGDNKK